MSGKNFHEVIQLICKEDSRYEPGAYNFLRQALDFTLGRIREEEKTTQHRHVTGQELSAGIRDFALGQYGPMTHTLLEQWGLTRTEDFGEIVFNLVEYGVFGKTDTDSREDFVAIFDFETAFKKPFQPASTPAKATSQPQEAPSESKK